MKCPVCSSRASVKFNSYKHHCYACYDCNSIFHKKKEGKYLLEKILPARFLSKIIPNKASLRLFHEYDNLKKPADFYDVYTSEKLLKDPVKISRVQLLRDQLDLAGIDIKNKTILDISGGPGNVAAAIKDICKDITVTEYSEVSVEYMKKNLNINAIVFDYSKDKLSEITTTKYDLILIRSSIIFCDHLEKFIESAKQILNEDGYILLETILPTLGEVFWWQQMEFKFPIIYSQMAIEKIMYKFGFTLTYGYREYGRYEPIKKRCHKGIGRILFTWLIDYPMMISYYLMANKSKIPIDQSLNHKCMVQIWQNKHIFESSKSPEMNHYVPGEECKSPDYSYVYNGYLKN